MNMPDHDPEGLRPHSYDGIQEYDKRLPNWWLFTLYGAIIFSIGYWAYFHWTGHIQDGWVRVQSQIDALKLAAAGNSAAPDGRKLWEMSREPDVVAAGEKTFMSTCAACHGADLKGGIGQNLSDASWVHGGTPSEIYTTITQGVLDKGMPSWGPLLGAQRISELVAFVISKNPTIAEPSE